MKLFWMLKVSIFWFVRVVQLVFLVCFSVMVVVKSQQKCGNTNQGGSIFGLMMQPLGTKCLHEKF